MRRAFHLGDFIEAALVTAAEGKNVGVVRFARAARGHYVMGKGGANARDFVGGDGNPDA